MNNRPGRSQINLNAYVTSAWGPEHTQSQRTTSTTRWSRAWLEDVLGSGHNLALSLHETIGPDGRGTVLNPRAARAVRGMQLNPGDRLAAFHRAGAVLREQLRTGAVIDRQAAAVDRVRFVHDVWEAAGLQRPGAGVTYQSLPLAMSLTDSLPLSIYDGTGPAPGTGLRQPATSVQHASLGHQQLQLSTNSIMAAIESRDADGDRVQILSQLLSTGRELAFIPTYPTTHTGAGYELLRSRSVHNDVRELRTMTAAVNLHAVHRQQQQTTAPEFVTSHLLGSAAKYRATGRPLAATRLRDLSRTLLAEQSSVIGQVHQRLEAQNARSALDALARLRPAERAVLEQDMAARILHAAMNRPLFQDQDQNSSSAYRIMESVIQASKKGRNLQAADNVLVSQFQAAGRYVAGTKRGTQRLWTDMYEDLQRYGLRTVRRAALRARLGLYEDGHVGDDASLLRARAMSGAEQYETRTQYTPHTTTAEGGGNSLVQHLRDLGVLDVQSLAPDSGTGTDPALALTTPRAQILRVRELEPGAGDGWRSLAGDPQPLSADGLRVRRMELAAHPQLVRVGRKADDQMLTTAAERLESVVGHDHPAALRTWDTRLGERVLMGTVGRGSEWDPRALVAGDPLTTANIQRLAEFLAQDPAEVRHRAVHGDQQQYARDVLRMQLSENEGAGRWVRNVLPGIMQDELGAVAVPMHVDLSTGHTHVDAGVRRAMNGRVRYDTGFLPGVNPQDMDEFMSASQRLLQSEYGTGVSWGRGQLTPAGTVGGSLTLAADASVSRSALSPHAYNSSRAEVGGRLSQSGPEADATVALVQLDPEGFMDFLQEDARRTHGVDVSRERAAEIMHGAVGDKTSSVVARESVAEEQVYISQRAAAERMGLEADVRQWTAGGAEMGMRKLSTVAGDIKSQALIAGHSYRFTLDSGAVHQVDMLQAVENVVRREVMPTVMDQMAEYPGLGQRLQPAVEINRRLMEMEGGGREASGEQLLASAQHVLDRAESGRLQVMDENGKVVYESRGRALLRRVRVQNVDNSTENSSVLQRVGREAEEAGGLAHNVTEIQNMFQSMVHTLEGQGLESSQAHAAVHAAIGKHLERSAADGWASNGELQTNAVEVLSQVLGDVRGMTGPAVAGGQEEGALRQAVNQAQAIGGRVAANAQTAKAASEVVEKAAFAAGNVAQKVFRTRGGLGAELEKHALQILGQFLK